MINKKKLILFLIVKFLLFFADSTLLCRFALHAAESSTGFTGWDGPREDQHIKVLPTSPSKTKPSKKLWLSLTKTKSIPNNAKKRPLLVLFDTGGNEPYAYQKLMDTARAAQFEVEYYSMAKTLDTPLEKIPLKKFDCAVFILCNEFFKKINQSLVSQKFLSIMEKHFQNEHQMSVFMMPSIRLATPNPVSILNPIFDALQSPTSHKIEDHFTTFQEATNKIIRYPIESRPLSYNTMLSPPGKGKILHAEQDLSEGAQVALLPIKQDFPQEIKNLLPFGTYYFSPHKKHHVIVTSKSLLTFSEIAENFQICPLPPKTKKLLHCAAEEMIHEWHDILTQKADGIVPHADAHHKLCIDDSSAKIESMPTKTDVTRSKKTISNRQSHAKKEKIAWMEINCFSPKDKSPDKLIRQKNLIKHILNAQLDNLWITINPQECYSPIGKKRKDEKNFLSTISAFTKQLSAEVKRLKTSPPNISVGFEITNNIYKPNMPKNMAVDIYGNTYFDIPNPLDEKFWENEIINPLRIFAKKWKNPDVSHGIPLKIIIDLEMYGRKTTGSFLPTMGFAQATIKNYLAPLSITTSEQQMLVGSINKPTEIMQSSGNIISQADTYKPHAFIRFLVEHGLVSDYFSFLEKKAEQLGQKLRKSIEKILPNATVDCYAPNISPSWPYKEFYRAFSTKEKPISLLTFNTEYNEHRPWLEKNKIFAKHIGVLMLSKIAKEKDFKIINDIFENHDGIWINRFSRLVEPPKKDWSYLEQILMPMNKRMKFTKYLKDVLQPPEQITPANKISIQQEVPDTLHAE